MSDGGYSRLEKDFLGNERMVHYDAAGNMLGASDVIREEDGTIRISNDPIPLNLANDLPKVEAVVPTPKPPISDPVPGVRAREQRMPVNQVVTYSIGAFIATLLLTLGALSFMRSSTSTARIQTISPAPQPSRSPSNDLPLPDDRTERENFPGDPRPRNDEDPDNSRPFDNTAPDSNMDDNRPRIDPNDSNPPDSVTPSTKPKKGPEDPIDLRGGDGDKTDPAKKGDPGEDPLRGDDIH